LTLAEQDLISSSLNKSQTELGVVIGNIIAARALLGWSTIVHSGVDVNVYSYGYQAEQFRGNMDNTELGKRIAEIFNLDLQEMTNKLKDFVPYPTAIPKQKKQQHWVA